MSMPTHHFFLIFIIFWGGVACNSNESTSSNSKKILTNQFQDSTLRKIYDLQDKRNTQALLPYLQHKNTIYREASAWAFGSIQDSLVLKYLYPLLQDSARTVRQATAYAIGQTRHTPSSKVLIEASQKEKEATVQLFLLEAIGKCATEEGVRYLNNWKLDNQTIRLGVARGIFRAGLRNLFFLESSAQMKKILLSQDAPSSEVASVYFARFSGKTDIDQDSTLFKAFQNSKSDVVKMNCVLAMESLKPEMVIRFLSPYFFQTKNYLIRLNILKTIRDFPFTQTNQLISNALKDENNSVQVLASEILLAQIYRGEKFDTLQLQKLANKHPSTLFRINLLTASHRLQNQPDSLIRNRWKKEYAQSQNIYQKNDFLQAIAQSLSNFDWLATQYNQESNKVLKGMILENLIGMTDKLSLKAEILPSFYESLSSIFRDAIESKDVALVYHASSALQKSPKIYAPHFKNLDFVQKTLNSLTLPLDIEAYIELKKAMAALEGKPLPSNFPTSTNQPIDWKLVSQISPTAQAIVQTNKGVIKFQLNIHQAPGSVATFVKLAKAGFYNQKTFHRVVPNFVVQGGCPRGDGFGGLDYTIRSEFSSLYYQTGSVGLASAGKDTESCQWFITHSPTPHLDGRYTIFAQVIDGMEVVHQIQIGDIIEKIIIHL